MSEVYADPRFVRSERGPFFVREGVLGRDACRSQQKVCVAATNTRKLADLLYGLSQRDDCAFVKYAAVARDGMVLGRCLLQSDAAAGELCQALKGHPHFLVTLQDDAFFAGFRAHRTEGVDAATGVEVLDVWPQHAEAVASIQRAAFGRPDEAGIVARVVASGAATISLIARRQGELLGHVLLSPVTLDGQAGARPPDTPPGLGLGPVAVRPGDQGRGVGAALIRAALCRARLLGYGYVVVLGHPSYYPRFGFTPASRFGLTFPAPVPDEAFMALPLRPGALPETPPRTSSADTAPSRFFVRYLPAFG